MNIAERIDHTILKPTTSLAEVKSLCDEAVEYGFAAVCIPPPFVRNAAGILSQTNVQVATVIGFPFGYSAAKAKIAEVGQAIADNVDELDIVINLIALKSAAWKYLESEMKQLCEMSHGEGKKVKVIIESGLLTDDEIKQCCEVYSEAGADYLKTSTGYAEKGATVEAVQLMRTHLPSRVKIKASGGIRNFEFAKQLVEAGADRLGCSASVSIVKQDPGFSKSDY